MNYPPITRLLIKISFTIIFCLSNSPLLAATSTKKLNLLPQELAALESSSGGRIGISAINIANNSRIEYRGEERFPVCSTAKLMVVSAILKRSMINSHFLEQKVIYKKTDLAAGYSPITKKHLIDGMTISELCEAAIAYSDSTAMNILVKKLGGPKEITSFARSIGNNTFRLDRLEPKLNSAIPGDLRDTSTPAAMERSLQLLAFDKILAVPQQIKLKKWLKSNTTGNLRIRAGLPKDWIVGDKTGSGKYGTTNDIGIIWPPKCSPIIIAIYFTQTKKAAAPRDDVIATTTRIILDYFAHADRCLRLAS